jgi:hypothetical protein
MSDTPSERIVQQRLRNRIIESLELAASIEDQHEYQRRVPFVDVPTQIINRWEDFVGRDWRRHYPAGDVFTLPEIDAIAEFDAVWNDVAERAPDLPLEALALTADWKRLMETADRCLQVFLHRGRLPED